MLGTPVVKTAAADYSFAGNATTASQAIGQVMSVIATQLRQATRDGRVSIGEWQQPTLNVVNIHADPMPVIGDQWHHARLNADSDTLWDRSKSEAKSGIPDTKRTYEDHSYSCIAADNRRRHMRRV